LALSKEHEKCVERVTQTPKYRTLSTHCSSEPSDSKIGEQLNGTEDQS